MRHAAMIIIFGCMAAVLPAAMSLGAGQAPDGGRIAYFSIRDDNADIFVIDLETRSQVRLTSDPANDYTPSWSPDATRIVFNTNRDGNWEIYLISVDGTVEKRLTHQ